MDATKDKEKAEHHYFRVIITYNNSETSGNRVFKDREKAEEWAARQKKSPVVKKTVIELFIRQQHRGRRVTNTKPLTLYKDERLVVSGRLRPLLLDRLSGFLAQPSQTQAVQLPMQPLATQLL
jgi:hypothetical protein